MAYPTDIRLPDSWEIVSKEVTRWNGETVTDWYFLTDGKRPDSFIYRSRDEAERIALRRAELIAVHSVIEEAIGQERHYGIRVWSEPNPTRNTPTWRITDPYKEIDGFAFAWYTDIPPPVEIYTREQYETACAALELEPVPDSRIGRYDASGYDSSVYTARETVTVILRQRRIAGIVREEAIANAERQQELEAAGLGEGPYTREQYEQACQIMHATPLNDSGCWAVVDQDLDRLGGGVIAIIPGAPTDKISVELAYRRVAALEKETVGANRHCDECGTVIIGSAMMASLGVACGPDCYDAMSDRPGRYAQRNS